MSLLAGEGDYPAVQEVALQASKVVPGNVSAYYWMTVSLYQLGGKDAAQKVVESIRSKLTEEEFEDLPLRLREYAHCENRSPARWTCDFLRLYRDQ